jgi:hypothetical protein
MKQSQELQDDAIASSFLQPTVRKLRNDNWAFFYLEHTNEKMTESREQDVHTIIGNIHS